MIEALSDQDSQKTFNIKGLNIDLETSWQVFSPSSRSLFLAEHIQINRGESIIDIGTGTGFFAIISARLGGKSTGTDIVKSAVELAKKNAQKNHVSIDFHEGPYFAGLDGNFDVIIANLPQKLILGQDRPGTNGGASGNEIIVPFLKEAKKHMSLSSRLYTLVNTLSDYHSTIRTMSANYDIKLLGVRDFPENGIIREDIEGYKKLNKEGTIMIFERDGVWHARGYCYELHLPQRNFVFGVTTYHPVVERIKNLLVDNACWFEIFGHEPVRTSKEAADVRKGYTIQQGAKAILVRVKESGKGKRFAMLVLQGDRKFDKEKIRKQFNLVDVRFATEVEIKAITAGILPGGMPPFGNLFNIDVYADNSLLRRERIVFNAGDRSYSIAMKSEDYIKIVKPVRGDFVMEN